MSDEQLYVSLAEVEHALDESSLHRHDGTDATIDDVRRRIRDAAVGSAKALCPCHGTGTAVEVLTPDRQTGDPDYRDREWECPGPGCLVVPTRVDQPAADEPSLEGAPF